MNLFVILIFFSYGVVVAQCSFGALRPEGRRFESHSSRHVGTLDKSFAGSCL